VQALQGMSHKIVLFHVLNSWQSGDVEQRLRGYDVISPWVRGPDEQRDKGGSQKVCMATCKLTGEYANIVEMSDKFVRQTGVR
jgi:hypothetical protein